MKVSALTSSGLSLRLIPPLSHLPPKHRGVAEAKIGEIQKFRGKIYFEEGAIPNTALDPEGRHRSGTDSEAFHIFLTTIDGSIAGTLRLRLPPPRRSRH